ncbi:hypothetical protein LTR56_007019 [Elasticomyces elasticus]|nr:hypothetical protein LTR56_007019 [Elasticomyces elasticus]KAK3664112.1 hypothetical protein LTR22_005076 [Elasticomyces elasticus]KAK4927681.1 hypothetical protein LTR49_005550 [Elasticomyces elasticus]KAK5767052.1 hypothetical protein LTS12_002817 [Elasticomyces elasticus]
MAFPSPTQAFHTSAYPAIDPTLDALSTKGKNIVITGGGAGIGSEIAKAFAKSGAASIALLGRTEKTLSATKQAIESEFEATAVRTYVADITSAKGLDHSISAHAKEFGKFHVLVANAGFLPLGQSIVDSTLDEWYEGFEVNVKGNYNLVRAFLPHANADAAILSINTVLSQMAYIPGMSSYSASKIATAKLFEYLHYEHPELFVLSIHPGSIKTAMNAKAVGTGKPYPYDNIDLPASFLVWAASDKAKFLNGKFVWAQWDVEELSEMAETIKGTEKFTFGLLGWP